MKILFIISTLRAGGAERVASILASYFANFHEVSLLRFENAISFYELNPKIRLLNLGLGAENLGIVGNLKKRFSKIFALRKIIANSHFDAVISFMDSTNLLSIVACMGLKQRLIISEHSYHGFLSLKWRILKRIFYTFARGLSVLSADDLKYYEFTPNTAVIYNPVTSSLASNLGREFTKENIIIFVGRLLKVKGCDIFLNSLKFLDLRGWKIVVLGDGEERVNLEKLSADLGLEVEFLGAVKDIEKYYEKARIIVSSSRFEGLGNALIEALFFDVVRVATPTSGARELINSGFDGVLSENFEPQNLAKKIEFAIANGEKLAQNARIRAGEFKIETIYQKWLNLIEKADFGN